MEYISCALCGADTTKVLARKGIFEKNGPVIKFINVICRRCGLVYINPRPPNEELREMYEKEYLRERHHIQSGSDAREFLSQIGKEKGDQLLRFIEEYLHEGSRICDVGAGLGVVLAYLRNIAHVEVFGIEPSIDSVHAAKKYYGVDMFTGTFDEYYQTERGEALFDCIILHHVFEHFGDPVEKLSQLGFLLSPHGVLYIEVPNIVQFSKPISQFFDYCHLYNYTPRTLFHMLKKCHFKIIKWNQAKRNRIQIIASPEKSSWPALSEEIFGQGNEVARIRWYCRRRQLYELFYAMCEPLRRGKQMVISLWHH